LIRSSAIGSCPPTGDIPLHGNQAIASGIPNVLPNRLRVPSVHPLDPRISTSVWIVKDATHWPMRALWLPRIELLERMTVAYLQSVLSRIVARLAVGGAIVNPVTLIASHHNGPTSGSPRTVLDVGRDGFRECFPAERPLTMGSSMIMCSGASVICGSDGGLKARSLGAYRTALKQHAGN
jgi:hypothetical protein